MKIKIDKISRIGRDIGFESELMKGNQQTAKVIVNDYSLNSEDVIIGSSYDEVHEVAPRLFHGYSISHAIAAIKAVENAMQVRSSKQTLLLRKLLMIGHILESHVMYLHFSSIPDFSKTVDALKFSEKYYEFSKKILKLEEYARKICILIGGRSIHPIAPKVGGFTSFPRRSELKKIMLESDEIMPIALEMVKFVFGFKFPEFESESNYFALSKKKSYPICDGEIFSDGMQINSNAKFYNQIKITNTDYDLANRFIYGENNICVGALARINVSSNNLNSRATKLLSESPIKLPDSNPFHAPVAQVIEIVHLLEEIKKVVPKLLAVDLEKGNTKFKPKSGKGLGVIESPSGTLFHYYEVDDSGKITECKILTPFELNLLGIEKNLKNYIELIKNSSTVQQEDMIAKFIRVN